MAVNNSQDSSEWDMKNEWSGLWKRKSASPDPVEIYCKNHPLQAPADFFSSKDHPHFWNAFIPCHPAHKSPCVQVDVQAGCVSHPSSREWRCQWATRLTARRRFASSIQHNSRIAKRLYPGALLRCLGLSERPLQLLAHGHARLAALLWLLVLRHPCTPRYTEPPCPGK